MSPRSRELLASARERLAAARTLLEAGLASSAVNPAYYAMLYAARAALSEEDRYATSHAGTWALLRETLVNTGRLDPALAQDVAKAQELRHGADDEARDVDPAEAAALLDLAKRFVRAIEELYAA